MRRLNVKLALILGIGLVLSALTVHFVHAYQIDSSASLLPERAEKFKAEGNYDDACKVSFRYTQYRPDDPDGWDRLADIYIERVERPESAVLSRAERGQNFKEAVNQLEVIVGDHNGKTKYRRKLANYLVAWPRLTDAIAHFQRVLEAEPDDIESAVMLAHCLYQTSDGPNKRVAIERLYKLVGYDPQTGKFEPSKAQARNSVPAYLEMARIVRRDLNDDKLADKTCDAMVGANRNDFHAYAGRAQSYFESKRMKEALADIERAVQLDAKHEDISVVIAAVQINLANGNPKRANELLEAAAKNFPKSVIVYLAQEQVARLTGQTDKAMEYIAKGLAEQPDNPNLLERKASLQAEEGNLAAARETMKVLEHKTDDPQSPLIERLRGQISLKEGRYADAMRQLESARKNVTALHEQIPIDRWLAQCYGQLDQYDRQIEVLTQILATNKSDFYSLVLLARGYESIGKSDLAYETYSKAAEQLGYERFFKTPEVWGSYFELALRRELRKPEKQRNWDDIKNLFDKVRKFGGADPTAIIKRQIDILERQDKLEEMRKQIDVLMKAEMAKTDPKQGDLQVWFMHVRLLAREKGEGRGPQAAMKVLDEIEKRFGDSEYLRLQRAQMIVQTGGPNVQRDLAALELNAEKLNRKALWRGLTTSYLQIRNMDEVKRLVKQVVAEDPNDLGIRMQLFDWSLLTNDDDGMNQALAEIEKLMGKDSTIWRYCTAARLVSQARNKEDSDALLEQARSQLKIVAEKRPKWHLPPRLDAEISRLQNDRNGVIVNLTKALDLGPADPRSVETLARMYVDKGQYDDARKAIDRLGEAKMPVELRQLDAELEFIVADSKELKQTKAEEITESLMSDLEADHQASAANYLWYANMLTKLKKPNAAEKALRKAVEKEPSQATNWLNLVRHLASQQKLGAANDVIRDIELALPDDELALVLPDCYQMVGKTREAERLYKELLVAAPNNPAFLRALAGFYLTLRQYRLAGAQIDLMLANGGPRLDPQLVWARREKAKLLANTGDFTDFQEGMNLIKANYVDGKPSLVDTALEVQLLQARPEFTHWDEAIKKLMTIKAVRVLPTNLQMLLAQLYDKTNEWEKCRQELYAVGRTESRDPYVLAAIVDLFLKHKEAQNAETWMVKLEAVLPKGSPERIRRRAMIDAGNGKRQEAIKQLATVLPPPLKAGETEKDENLQRILFVAGEFARMKETDKAEALYRRFVKARPEQNYVLAQFLAFRGQEKSTNEALDIGDQLLADLNAGKAQAPVDALLDLGSKIYRFSEGKLTTKQTERIVRWFDKIERENADSVNVKMRVAELYDLRHKTPDAIRIYREIIEKSNLDESQRGLVLNNAAFLVALGGGDLDEAAKWAAEAVRLLGPRSDVLDTRGMVYFMQGDHNKALEDLRATVKGGSTAVKQFHLALAENAAGNRTECREAWRKMKESDLDVNELSSGERKLYDRLNTEMQAVDAEAAERAKG
jgi:tetratricopeptide (TPR) repeat protein